jgi:hypothetical protein
MRTGGRCWRAVAIAAACGFFSPRPASPFDCNDNLVDDFAEVQAGDAPDCDGNGIPDGCDVRPVNLGLAPGPTVIVERGPTSSIAADIDGDGKVDLALALRDQAAYWLLWGDGTGSFSSMTVPGNAVTSLAVGDVTGDGLLDIVGGGPGVLIVSRQMSGRRFQQWASFPLESARGSLAVSDFDGDGQADIAFAAPFEILVFRNEGPRLSEPKSIPAGSGPIHLIAADLDGDGDADIATANFLSADPAGSVSVFLNRGDGTFLAPRNFAVGSAPASLEVGDVDGNGFADLVTSNAGSSDVSMLFGRGNGTFAPAPRIPIPEPIASAALGDLDLDGDLDLAVSQSDVPLDVGRLSIYWNHGSRVFRRGFRIHSGGALSTMGIRNIYGDPSPEVFVAELNQIQLRFLEKALVAHQEDCDRNGVPDVCDIRDRDCNGNGFVDACDLTEGRSQDCDGDGIPNECESDCNLNGTPDDCDVASGTSADCNGNSSPDECDIRSSGFGFKESVIAGQGLTRLLARDLDADGRPDLAGIDVLNNVLVHWNDGDAGRGPAKVAISAGSFSSLAAGDIDGDGDLDLIAGGPLFRSLQVVVQSGKRAWASPADFPLSGSPLAIATTDLDHDGRADVAAASSTSILLLHGREDGRLGPERPGPSGVAPDFLTIADMDGDGSQDLIAILISGAPAVFWNRGDASFEERSEMTTAFFFQTLAVEDLDGDGDLDVAAGDAGNVLLFLQTVRRTFERSPAHLRGLELRGLVTEDLNRDGLTDIAVAQAGFFQRNVVAFLQEKDGMFEAIGPIGRQWPFLAIASADFDGDGGVDLAASLVDCLACPATPIGVLLRNLTIPAASRDLNENGRPDECDLAAFHRGDTDGNGMLDLADAVLTLRSLFQGGPAPACAESADADNDGSVNVTDPVLLLEFLFRSGRSPAAPGPPPGPCGPDTDPPGSAGDMGCAIYESC